MSGFQTTFSQVITSVPPTTGNNRYFDEVYSQIKRPALSVIGFDDGGDHSKGYGLKQILNQVYVTGSNEQKNLFKKIITYVNVNSIEPNPANANEIETNSNILQYEAFEALCSFVLEENGISSSTSGNTYGIPIRDHQTVINSFTSDIMTLVNADKLTSPGDDYVKNVETYMNVARSIDLYLALENVYTKWTGHSGNTSLLLSQSEKQQLMERFIADLQNLYDNHVHKHNGLGINDDEVEPGNRPFKGHLALGYSVLAMQDANGWDGVDERLSTAISKASDYAGGSDRTIYWNYQTSGGEPYWAEGPYYFNFAMLDVIPFWHAVRANGLLGSVTDPYTHDWFLKPVEWLADVSTPDGLTPPLDDGNKHRINSSAMLRWSGVYGNSSMGAKFNTIYQQLKSKQGEGERYRLSNNTYLIELAIPKTSSSTPINYDINSSNNYQDYQQKIVRDQDNSGKMHYLLLNGEQGNAITRGEGHEQPDQLQLLYYVGDTSYLIDAGYDKPLGEGIDYAPSTWNHYRYNNVMMDLYYETGGIWEGGLKPPYIDILKKRIVSEHSPVQYLSSITDNKVKILSSKVQLHRNTDHTADYKRSVLFIKDPIHPYVIDLNDYTNQEIENIMMLYHGNSDNISSSNNWYQWDVSNSAQSNDNLFAHLGAVETEDDELSYDIRLDSTEEAWHKKKVTSHLEVDAESKFFTTVGFFQVNEQVPSYAPKEIFANTGTSGTNAVQGWYWKKDTNTVDIIIKRSKVDMDAYDQAVAFNINGQNISISNLKLPGSADYGFARLVNTPDGWEIDSDYQVNIGWTNPVVTISGPAGLQEGQSGTWQADGSGGKPPYSYTWSRKLESQSSTVYIGSGQSFSMTAPPESFTLYAHIQDDNSNTAIVGKFVTVLGGIPKHLSSKRIPDDFEIKSNYPNPFNPTTTIRYGIPEQASVTLNVYNILGQRVADLVNETKAAGYYSVNFDASHLASGLYIGRLTALGKSGKKFVKEMKMQLIK